VPVSRTRREYVPVDLPQRRTGSAPCLTQSWTLAPRPNLPWKLAAERCYEARFVGAGLARERERSSRQDARDFANGSTNSLSGILPAGFAGLSRAGPAPTKLAL